MRHSKSQFKPDLNKFENHRLILKNNIINYIRVGSRKSEMSKLEIGVRRLKRLLHISYLRYWSNKNQC